MMGKSLDNYRQGPIKLMSKVKTVVKPEYDISKIGINMAMFCSCSDSDYLLKNKETQ